MKIRRSIFLTALVSFCALAQDESFEKGRQQFGLSELGIGYSNVGGLLFSAQTQYEYFVINRVSLGAGAFYRNLGGRESRFEYFGAGPSATYYFWRGASWFAALGQNLMFSKYNGDRENMSFTTTTSSLGINQFFSRNAAIGLNVNYSHALDGKEIIRPVSFGVGINAFF